ncbi:molybdate ABC transporter substrate-binding protein [Kaistia geumhonensis]|uniref:Molybdate transport system substrate-binding protein n=1 Tax=Kaistia geumhonensis TaxID=410839 RepID=A0ABU0MC12_9HYPH|nr:molybdate ABC transporter substrate-binding protein [Kaistia geumhonensis]MCX5481279.1 molybdate ABC transporter substrate-binding protein [Kaistia geumhonensis]MDQ0518340.1 molybdate transport system substrate-binding protein [Kaistia geumhonensis]
MTFLTRRFAAALAGLALLAMPLAALPAGAADTVVFAAASLKDALGAAVEAYEAKSGGKVVVSYAGSSQLARQIEAGAPADLFISADLDWMDELDKKDLIDPASRVTLLGNTLVLVAPKASTASLVIAPGFPLAEALGADGKLAMAAVASVPAGKYGKAALEKLGVWAAVAPHVAEADNVRAALAYVARGEAPFGIVYGTDARAEPDVRVVGTFPEDSHKPIVYPLARIKASTNPGAEAFLAFLRSAEARAIFEGAGFTVPDVKG